MYNIHVVRFFDFVPDPIKWVSVLNNKAELCVILKGNFPNFFFNRQGLGTRDQGRHNYSTYV